MKRSETLLRIIRFRRFSAVQLLIALGLLFTSAPFVEEIKGGEFIISALVSLVLLSGVLAVAERKRVLIIALLLAIPAVGGVVDKSFTPGLGATSCLPCRRTCPDLFCSRHSTALHPARSIG